MMERRFYIIEVFAKEKDDKSMFWNQAITEAELKRRLDEIAIWCRSRKTEGAIDILLHGTVKEEPAIPELPADCEPPEVLKPHKQATEQEWEKWAESMPSAPGEPWEWSNKMRNWALAIPCRKRREG